MLELLRIRNLALIDDLELEFAPGLNVLTGETGAGKSFILKAVGFITGEKMSQDLVRPGADRASVEAVFVLPKALFQPVRQDNGQDHGPDPASPVSPAAPAGQTDPAETVEIILRRELVAETGRSRLYLNDRLASQDTLRDLKPAMVLHTSQHGQERLLQPSYQAQILDSFLAPDVAGVAGVAGAAGGPGGPDRGLPKARDEALARLREVVAARKAVQDRSRELEARRDLLEYQQSEIAKVGPEPGEEERLLERKQALASVEQAKACRERALDLLLASETGLVDSLSRLARELDAMAASLPDLAEDQEGVADARQRLADLATRLRRKGLFAVGGDSSEGPESPEAIEARLWELSKLKRALRRSLDEILSLRTEIEDNLSFLDACGLDLKRLDKEERGLATELGAILDRLNQARRRAAAALKTALENELRGLGFSEHVSLEFEFSPRELYPGLAEDRPRIFWIPNPGQAAQPLDKIASGGELSRFLLAATGLLAQADLPTLIFDEVDAGVGGLTLNRLGERIKSLAARQQVILITHWPQLASLADRHFQVRKEVRAGETFTLCKRLAGPEVVDELARMAGGGERGEELARRLVPAGR